MKIKVLSDNLINKIAAGEVIERPASVVKELVENAIDAGASQISVAIKGYGIEEIKVTDNGSGISPEELPNVLKRHATSKISTEKDLNNILTLGFRGEAIPAIAQVSELTITSKTKSKDGHFIKVKDGEILEKGKISAKQGTQVLVKNLFYNTPARYKYLKSETTEKKAISDFITEFAIANPKIRFSLTFDEAKVIETFGQDNPKDLITSLYGNSFTNNLVEVSDESAKIKINLLLLSPDFQRSTKQDISIIINGRFVFNFLLKEAIIEGYSGYLMTKKYPIAICYITLDPYLIDVNVHPQKLTIKLVNEYALKAKITTLVKEALLTKYKKFTYETAFKDQPKEEISYKQSEFLTTSMPDLFLDSNYLSTKDTQLDLFKGNELIVKKDHLPRLEYLGQFHKTYLLFQAKDGLYLLDQHACAERINYEKFSSKEIDLKNLTEIFFPYMPNLNPGDIEILKKNKQYFKRYGFTISTRGEVLKYPIAFKDINLDFILEYLISTLNNNVEPNFKTVLSEKIKQQSCKASIRANDDISLDEITFMLRELEECDNPYHCPHGRPTIIKISTSDIEKLFKRVV